MTIVALVIGWALVEAVVAIALVARRVHQIGSDAKVRVASTPA